MDNSKKIGKLKHDGNTQSPKPSASFEPGEEEEADYRDVDVEVGAPTTTTTSRFSSCQDASQLSKNQSRRMANEQRIGFIPSNVAAMRERRVQSKQGQPVVDQQRSQKGLQGVVTGESRISNPIQDHQVSSTTTTSGQVAATSLSSPPSSKSKGLRRRLAVRPPTTESSQVSLPRKAGLRRPAPRPLLIKSHSEEEEEEEEDFHMTSSPSEGGREEEEEEEEEEKQELEFVDEEYQPERRSTLAVEAILVEDIHDDEEDRQRIEEEIRNRILQEAVIGEAIVEAAEASEEEKDSPLLLMGPEPKKRKRVAFGCVTLFLVSTIGVVFSVLLAQKTSENQEVVEPSAEVIPLRSTSNESTLSPTVSIISNQPPLSQPSTDEPSSLPSLSIQPTFFPTMSNESRNNTKREEAKFLDLRSPPLKATISSFVSQQVEGVCRRSRGMQEKSRSLVTWIEDFKALWYIYTPKVSGPVSVTTCGGPAKLEVFESKFQCFSDPVFQGVFAFNRDMGSCGGTSFSWEAIEGHTYTILLYLEEDDDTDDNNPQINGSDNDNLEGQRSNIFLQEQEPNDVITIQVVDNDLCQYAFGPVTPTSAGVVLSYNTFDATVDRDQVQVSCGGSSAPSAPGVWYTIKGTGRPITASTCSDDQLIPTFDTQISVFRGDGCQNLVCVNGNDDACGGQHSSVTWPSQSEEIYYLLVHGPSSDHNHTQGTPFVGKYQLTVSTDFDRLENDFCGSAQDIQQGNLSTDAVNTDFYEYYGSVESVIHYSFAGSTEDQDIPCLKSESIPYGIWYVFEGSGDALYVAHYVEANEDIGVIVFNGTCGGLSCVTCGGQSCVSNLWSVYSGTTVGNTWETCFPTNLGETYYLYVYTTLLNALDEEHQLGLGSCHWM